MGVMTRQLLKSLIPGLLMVTGLAGSGTGADFIQLRGVMHVHSDFSSGRYSIPQLIEKAKSSGLEVLVTADHDLVVMEYGLFPLRNLIKKREERKSVLQRGPETYLAAIQRANDLQNNVIVIPGVQSSPFYYWTGSPVRRNLEAHDYRKELLLIGLDDARDYKHLPVLHNGLSTSYFQKLLPRSLVFTAVIVIGVTFGFHRGWRRIAGGLIAALGLLLLINHHPFASSRFDPYHGSQGIKPYQELIDYVGQRGGLVYWAHPESKFSQEGQKIGSITLQTRPYPEDLIHSTGYTGFSVLYGEKTTATLPGRHWDKLLKSFCQGQRIHPVWGIAGSDFHQETEWLKLDTLQTVFLVKAKTRSAVLNALKAGRTYAVLKSGPSLLTLDWFIVKAPGSEKTATMGETLRTRGIKQIEGKVTSGVDDRLPVRLQVIRNGRLWQQFSGHTPLEFHLEDSDRFRTKGYYRLIVDAGARGRLISNPVFVTNQLIY